MALGDLTVKGDTVLEGTTDLAGGALNTDVVTDLNADLLDGADLSTDGTLADNSDTAVPTEKAVKTYADARKAECVALTGDQEVAGVKTLTSIPVLPASDPTTDNQAARKAYVDGLTAASGVLVGGNLLGALATAGTNIIEYADTQAVHNETDWTKVKEIYCCVGGTIRVTYDAKIAVDADSARAQTYVNGVAAGVDNLIPLTSYTTFTDDLAVNAGDLVQLYIKKLTNAITERYFRIKIAETLPAFWVALAQRALVVLDA